MFKKLEIVEWMDEGGKEIVHRIPQSGSGEFRIGSQVVVRESQDAVFFRDGIAMGSFGFCSDTTTTENIPLLTGVVSTLFEGKDSPFRATVFYVNKKTFTDMKWGTKEPIIFRDKELSMVRLRAFGSFSMKVDQSQLFINKIVGTEGRFSADEIEGFLKGMIISRLADLLGETLEPIFDLAQYYDEIGTLAKSRLGDDFGKYGIQLVDFYVQAITPPEEVQARIDERSAMGALGDMNQYMRFKTATAMGDAAKNESGGGAAGAGVGMGAGLGMGMTMANMMGQTMAGGGQNSGGSGAAALVTCPSCGKNVVPGKFCPECGKPLGLTCSGCGNIVPPDSKFCPECGAKIGGGKKCSKCGADVPADSKFCPDCGEKQE